MKKIHQLNIIKIIRKYLRKKARERYPSLSKEKKNKSNNVVVNYIKVYEKMKNKSLLSIENIL